LANHTNQIHDFNLDFGVPVNAAGDRTFWTGAIPNHSVNLNPGKGTADMHVRDLDVEDYFSLGNALAQGHSVSATASFEVHWRGPVTRTVTVSDPVNAFTGTYNEDQARVAWRASEAGFTFVSDPLATSKTVFAEIGRERNGNFFSAAPPATAPAAPEAVTPFGALADSSAAPPAKAPTALEAVALFRALADSSAASVAARPLLLPPHAASVPDAMPIGSSEPARSALGQGQAPAGAAFAQVVDRVFAELDGSQHSDIQGSDAFALEV
jgi:hypothetical protein